MADSETMKFTRSPVPVIIGFLISQLVLMPFGYGSVWCFFILSVGAMCALLEPKSRTQTCWGCGEQKECSETSLGPVCSKECADRLWSP